MQMDARTYETIMQGSKVRMQGHSYKIFYTLGLLGNPDRGMVLHFLWRKQQLIRRFGKIYSSTEQINVYKNCKIWWKMVITRWSQITLKINWISPWRLTYSVTNGICISSKLSLKLERWRYYKMKYHFSKTLEKFEMVVFRPNFKFHANLSNSTRSNFNFPPWENF